eukprot:TRINITY_DN44594_c0_g2_i1.p1 TRINITY_DN44594_c0_g2~~TRINITY_DN44594_c0_g2_i1.p1  ORF type:complete len:990 (-),score=328.81 TRINITY_DN44594_c0_g2_i1:135-3104(-)
MSVRVAVPSSSCQEVPPLLSAEIAAAQNALVAVRADRAAGAQRSASSGASRSHSASRPSPRTAPAPADPASYQAGRSSRRERDTAWLALEERVTAQVHGLHQKHCADLIDGDRVLRASLTRIEARVRSLEGQAVRSDRRVAETQGLVQALTEEQRMLLMRTDRVEEHLRSGAVESRDGNSAAPEELHRRLSRLEHEQRAMAMNLRLIISVTEEAQHRQQQRMRSFEERISVQPASSSSAQPPKQRGGASETGSIADVERLQALLEASCGEPSVSSSSRGSGCRPGGAAAVAERLTGVEAHLQALQRSTEDLQARMMASAGSAAAAAQGTSSSSVEALQTTTTSKEELEAAAARRERSELVTMVESQRQQLAEVRQQLSLLPTHEHISAACGSLQAKQSKELEERLAATSKTLEQHSSSLQRLHEQLEATLAERLGSFEAAEPTPRRRKPDVAAVADDESLPPVVWSQQLEARLEACVQQAVCRQLPLAVVKEDPRQQALDPATLERLAAATKGFEVHSAAIEVLRQRLDALAVTVSSQPALDLRLSEQLEHEIELLRARMEAIASTQLDRFEASGKRSERQEADLTSLRNRLEDLAGNLPRTETRAVQEQAEAVADLKQRCEASSLLAAQAESSSAFLREDVSNLRRECTSIISELREKLQSAVQSAQEGLQTSSAQHLQSLRQELEASSAQRMQDLRDRLEAQLRLAEQRSERDVSSCHVQLSGLRSEAEALGKRMDGQKQEVAGLQERLTATAAAAAKATAACAEATALATASSSQAPALPGEDGTGPAAAEAMEVLEDVAMEVKDLRIHFEAVQEVVESQVATSLWQVEQQLPEVLQKVDRLVEEHAAQMGKVEEHEVRMNLAMTKLSVHDGKVQSCIDRLEKVAGSAQLRSQWREDIHRSLEDANVESLRRKVRLQGQAIEDLLGRMQDVWEQLVGPSGALLSSAAAFDSAEWPEEVPSRARMVKVEREAERLSSASEANTRPPG